MPTRPTRRPHESSGAPLRFGKLGLRRFRGGDLLFLTTTGRTSEQMWRTLNERVFDYDSYQRKVSRQIAVVALTPTGA